MTRRVAVALLCALMAVAGLSPVASGSTPAVAAQAEERGTLEEHVYEGDFGSNPYLVYTPASYLRAPQRPVPVVVMIHGCNTFAHEQAAASAWHEIAERERFLVVYPDNTNEAAGVHRWAGTHPGQCWRWYDATSNRRGSGDPAQLAGLTREVMDRWNVDRRRVYAVGMSSGAMMTSVLGATYPDLYAAIGVVAGCAYLATACLGQEVHSQVESPELQARAAHAAMGEHARVVPMIEMHGGRDTTIPPAEGASMRCVSGS